MSEVLLVDIGGTNMRYAYSKLGLTDIYESKRMSLENLDNFNDIIQSLINHKNYSVKNAVFSIAGPKISNTIKMTNRSFSANSDTIKENFLLEQCYLLNDWESIGYSLTSTPENDIKYLKQGISFNSNTLVLGPGTGLGAAFSNGGTVLPTEIGNTTNWTSALLTNFNISNDGTFLILEDIISGTGISKLYKALAGECISAEEVIKRFDKKEKNAQHVINGFISSLAHVLSDLALAYVPGNGIFLAGGLSRTLAPLINHESFKEEFLKNKSSIHKDLLKNIKIGVITREHTCLYGNLNYFNFINKNN